MAFQVIGEFSTGNLPGDINNGLHMLVGTAGVVDVANASLEVTEKSGTPDLSVDVAVGVAAVANIDDSFGSGSPAFFPFRNTAVYNVTINANGAGNPRITSIFLEVDGAASDSTRGSAAGDIIAVDGTAAASPSAPATPVSANKSYLRLADVTVANGASSITDANITDQRVEAKLRDDIFDQIKLLNNKQFQVEDNTGTARNAATIDASNILQLGAAALSGFAINGTTIGFTSYTPTWSSTGTQPTVGNGTITGQTFRLGDLTIDIITLTIGSTTSNGTGTYRFSPSRTMSAALNSTAGFATLLDSGTAYYGGSNVVVTTSTVGIVFPGGTQWSAGTPFTLATGDVIGSILIYKAA